VFQRSKFNTAILLVAAHYEKTAPTVEQWCDWLCSAKDSEVTLADIHLLGRLREYKPQPNYAANEVYRHQRTMGRDTTGQAGF